MRARPARKDGGVALACDEATAVVTLRKMKGGEAFVDVGEGCNFQEDVTLEAEARFGYSAVLVGDSEVACGADAVAGRVVVSKIGGGNGAVDVV